MVVLKKTAVVNLLTGLVFVCLWASAGAATKIGLKAVQPLILAVTRFLIAAAIMLSITHIVMRNPLPKGGKLWRQIALYGFLNVGFYLGLYVIALKEVSAGIASLFIAINPVIIMLFSAVYGKKRLKMAIVFSFLLCMVGMTVAAYPLLGSGHASWFGLSLLLIANLSYAFGAIYFAKQNWQQTHILTINAWQTLIGSLYLLPFALFYYQPSLNQFGLTFWAPVTWLAIPTSVVATLLWMHLLRRNPTKASAWLFLCPAVGFAIAALVIGEPITAYTLAGMVLVIIGLYVVQSSKTEITEATNA